MDRWVVLYDAECGLCMWLLAGILRWDQAKQLEPVALQRDLAARLLADLSPEARYASWHLLAPGGERCSGGAALAPMLHKLPYGSLPALAFASLPSLTDTGYRWVAAHRRRLSRLVPAGRKRRSADFVRERERVSGERDS
jgi:predicted DCC family thiol-disulfide oxidoreductase YuxK